MHNTGQPKTPLVSQSYRIFDNGVPHSSMCDDARYKCGKAFDTSRCILQQLLCIGCCVPSAIAACMCVCVHHQESDFKKGQAAMKVCCYLCPKS